MILTYCAPIKSFHLCMPPNLYTVTCVPCCYASVYIYCLRHPSTSLSHTLTSVSHYSHSISLTPTFSSPDAHHRLWCALALHTGSLAHGTTSAPLQVPTSYGSHRSRATAPSTVRGRHPAAATISSRCAYLECSLLRTILPVVAVLSLALFLHLYYPRTHPYSHHLPTRR